MGLCDAGESVLIVRQQDRERVSMCDSIGVCMCVRVCVCMCVCCIISPVN